MGALSLVLVAGLAATPGAPPAGTPGAPPRQTPSAPGAVVIPGVGSSQLLPIDHSSVSAGFPGPWHSSGVCTGCLPPIDPSSGLAPRFPIGGGIGYASPGIPRTPLVLNDGSAPFGDALAPPIPGTAPPMPGTNPFTGMPELPPLPGQ